MSLTKLYLTGNIKKKLFSARKSLVSDIPAGDGKTVNIFYCAHIYSSKLRIPVFAYIFTGAAPSVGEGMFADGILLRIGRTIATPLVAKEAELVGNQRLHQLLF
jgi:hypothetical protein